MQRAESLLRLFTMRQLGLMVLVVSITVSGGSTTSCSSQRQPSANVTLRVRALLESTRPDAHGQVRTRREPLAGYFVIAVGSDGNRVKAIIDGNGDAAVRLPPGEYLVSTTLVDACPPTKILIMPGTDPTLRLPCVAP